MLAAVAAAIVARKGLWPRPHKRLCPSRRPADTGRTVPVLVPAPVGPRCGRNRCRPGRSAAWATVRRTKFSEPPATNSSPGRSCSTWWTVVVVRTPSSAAFGCRLVTSAKWNGAACPSGTCGAVGSGGVGAPACRCPPGPIRIALAEGTAVAVAGAAAVAGTVVAAVVDEAGAAVAAAGAPGTGVGAAVAGIRTGADTVCGAGPAARASATRRQTGALPWSR